jgi:hypothetical protein
MASRATRPSARSATGRAGFRSFRRSGRCGRRAPPGRGRSAPPRRRPLLALGRRASAGIAARTVRSRPAATVPTTACRCPALRRSGPPKSSCVAARLQQPARAYSSTRTDRRAQDTRAPMSRTDVPRKRRLPMIYRAGAPRESMDVTLSDRRPSIPRHERQQFDQGRQPWSDWARPAGVMATPGTCRRAPCRRAQRPSGSDDRARRACRPTDRNCSGRAPASRSPPGACASEY